jgi:hypothetical protein
LITAIAKLKTCKQVDAQGRRKPSPCGQGRFFICFRTLCSGVQASPSDRHCVPKISRRWACMWNYQMKRVMARFRDPSGSLSIFIKLSITLFERIMDVNIENAITRYVWTANQKLIQHWHATTLRIDVGKCTLSPSLHFVI